MDAAAQAWANVAGKLAWLGGAMIAAWLVVTGRFLAEFSALRRTVTEQDQRLQRLELGPLGNEVAVLVDELERSHRDLDLSERRLILARIIDLEARCNSQEEVIRSLWGDLRATSEELDRRLYGGGGSNGNGGNGGGHA